jgi:hypothetical protein
MCGAVSIPAATYIPAAGQAITANPNCPRCVNGLLTAERTDISLKIWRSFALSGECMTTPDFITLLLNE